MLVQRYEAQMPEKAQTTQTLTGKPGYVLDDTPQTVKVKAGETVTLEFRNQPKIGRAHV